MKAEYRVPAAKLQSLSIPEWKWNHITMDFVVGLPRAQRGADAVGDSGQTRAVILG